MGNYTLIHDDIDEGLIDYIGPGFIGSGTVFFYVERRHWLEIVPEGLVSLALVTTILAVVANWNPVELCRSLGCSWLSAILVLVSILMSIIFPFGIEMWRWQRHICYLSNTGWNESVYIIWPLHRLGYHNNKLGFLSSSEAAPNEYYRWFRVNVGYVMARSVDESRRFTPLMPRPATLQVRFDEARSYKPAPPKGDGKLWVQ